MTFELSSSSWGDEEIAALQRVITSGQFTMGPEVAAFEKTFAEYFGSRYAVMVNSGSSANLAAVASFFYRQENPLQRGDEVIVPAISWSTTYFPLQQYGLKLKFVDVDLRTLNVKPEDLEKAVTPKTRMIVGVSILGNPAALDTMRDLADRHGLYFLEDNAESVDAELKGRKTGTFGDTGTFSFFFSHHISTMEGGMVITDDEETCHLLRSIRAHGWTRDLPENNTLVTSRGDDQFEAYRFVVPGYNLRPTELSGAVGREQMKKLPAMTRLRRKNLSKFQSLFRNDERFIIQTENGKSSSFSFPIVLDPARNPDREAVFSALHENDIRFRIITGGCFTRHDAIKYFDYETIDDLPNANIAHDFGLFVGNHPRDLASELEKFYRVLDETCN
ncbi:MAG TPA: DegT/DnrJ/EryC1/StrS family aminotransferase [Sneathiellales bacterium]|jgi:CDP-6-deoxy-D-xylo-4-hexulose-3-dehydrase|nr:DegT/DnrJ/EryC1/StrS family aminotransferase [Sneathiellales bacterium]